MKTALVDGLGIRAAARITGVSRGTVAALALKVGRGCAALHDGKMVGVRTSKIECDELWSYIARKQANVKRRDPDAAVAGDAYTFVALSSSTRAIIAYHTAKRTTNPAPSYEAAAAFGAVAVYHNSTAISSSRSCHFAGLL